jgi:hypothetical protein
MGILVRGSGGGTYDSVDSYLSIPQDVWKVMEKWIRTDKSLPEIEGN